MYHVGFNYAHLSGLLLYKPKFPNKTLREEKAHWNTAMKKNMSAKMPKLPGIKATAAAADKNAHMQRPMLMSTPTMQNLLNFKKANCTT